MNRIAILLVLLMTSLVALAAAPAQSTSEVNSCGTQRTYYRDHGTRQYIEASSIRGRNVGCSRARYVAHKWARNTARKGGYPAHHAAGFHCRFKRFGSDIGHVSCRKGTKRVSFDEYDSSPYH